jgi:predicted Zn-dependent protease
MSPNLLFHPASNKREAPLGHEIAHAERRHSSIRLQKEFGVRRLLEFVVLSQPITMGDAANAAIVKDLVTLRYSRQQEAESNDYSVRYLASTSYACDGTAGFFQKILEEGDGVRIPEFLSDHPEPASRVKSIRAKASELAAARVSGSNPGGERFK